MDDTEDDTRYPPYPYSTKYHLSRPKLPIRNTSFPHQMDRRYLKEDVRDEDEYESEEDEEPNDIDRAMEDPEADDDDDDQEEEDEDEEEGSSYRRIRANEDSLESRGKRRKLDRFALGFEFAPRLATSVPSVPPAAASSRPPARNSPPDWSEHSTFVLLDAWGDLYLQNGRKSLRSDEWAEVSKKVNHASKTVRSDAQCRNRLDTLKKKYKKEKARMAESANSSSKWVYFKKMEMLMSSPPPPAAAPLQPRLPCGVDSGEYVFTNSSVYLNRSSGLDEMRDSPGDSESINDGDEEEEEEESDGLPPERVKPKGNPESSSFRILADSIQKFGEIYEKIENTKKQQMAELERMRREFHRDLEVQKRQILEQAQAEIAKLNQAEGEGEEEDEEEQEEEGEEEEDNDDGDDPNDVSAENVSG